jgi:mRNA interferase RelE/StbE
LIRAKINQYAVDPASLAQNVKALKGEDGVLRLRVGDWRVVFSETLEVIDVIKIASRADAYS